MNIAFALLKIRRSQGCIGIGRVAEQRLQIIFRPGAQVDVAGQARGEGNLGAIGLVDQMHRVSNDVHG